MTNKEFALWVYNAAKNVSDIDPLFVAAQAALESGWGKSGIGNKLFGHIWKRGDGLKYE